MGTIGFLLVQNDDHHVFAKNTFKYMVAAYTSGLYGTIDLYFAAEGNIVDPDKISLSVKKQYITQSVQRLGQVLSSSGYHEFTLASINNAGIDQHIVAITYTAG